MLVYLLNFVIILLSIVAFATPFYIVYWLRHRAQPQPVDINNQIEAFFQSRQANWMVFCWAAAEALIWYVIPEFLLLLLIFMRVRKKRQMLLYDVAGTVIGAVTAFMIHLPDRIVAGLPYVQDRMVEQARVWYDQHGLLGLANQPFSGVPFKVFTYTAADYGFFIGSFVVVAVVVRMARYLVAYGLFISLYPRLHRIVKHNYVYLALVAIAVFSVLLYKTYLSYS